MSNEERGITRTSRKCPQCLGPHGFWRCPTFKGLALKDRLKVVKQGKLCRICLDEGHFARSCNSGFTCRKEGCRKDHHFLIHGDQNDEKNDSNTKSQEKKTQNGSSTKDAATQNGSIEERHSFSRPRVCFKVVPVKVSSATSHKELDTYAFLDGGSGTTLCLESLVQELGVTDAEPAEYTMTTVNCQQRKAGYEVRLDIQSAPGDEKFQLEDVLTTDSLPVTPRHIAKTEEIQKWPHLQDIVLPKTRGEQVTILIGGDRPDIIDNYLDRRDGEKGEPGAPVDR